MVASRAVITYLWQLYILLQAILTLLGQVARHYPDPTVASSHRDLFVAAGFGFQCTWEHQRCTSVITDLPDLCIGKSMVYEEDSLNRGFSTSMLVYPGVLHQPDMFGYNGMIPLTIINSEVLVTWLHFSQVVSQFFLQSNSGMMARSGFLVYQSVYINVS